MEAKRENKTDILLESVIGKSLKEAKDIASFNGYTLRITKEDNESYICTMDFRFDRINIEIINGNVIKSSIG